MKQLQIEAPPCARHLTYEDKRGLDCWGEDDGWCSACGEGKDGEVTPVAHLGSLAKRVDFALCRGCIDRMRAALPGAVASLTAAKEET